ncbi:MAG TPA: N-acetyltransferase [Syntrophorhabdales bacterium]|nr:N-acetyltransferase [Syntrophorhabdales bacterium]
MLRKARISDIKTVHRLINECAAKGEMLSRSLAELYDNMRDYFVYEDAGEVLGACALHVCWEDLAEIRSLCVVPGSRKKGVGRRLVTACLDEAKDFCLERVFLLTYQEEFFGKLGFRLVDKSELPQKIWTDCIKCAKFPLCDEVAMVVNLVESNHG